MSLDAEPMMLGVKSHLVIQAALLEHPSEGADPHFGEVAKLAVTEY